jgi:hypothetical protein
MVELRLKYLAILKSIYWSKFEKGEMNSEAIIVLLESADKEIDNKDTPISDWEDIEQLIGDSRISWFQLSLSELPLIGNYMKRKQFEIISTSYEIVVNFYESHVQAQSLISKVIKDRKYVEEVIEEGRINMRKAEKYNYHNIESIFPEICKSI